MGKTIKIRVIFMKETAQFIHIETYADIKEREKKAKEFKNSSDVRSTSARGILKEAKRVDGFCPHVPEPEQPELLYGLNLEEVEMLMDDYIKNFRLIDKNGKERRARSDASVILAGVVSLDRRDEDVWDDYKKDAILYLINKYGDRLKSVIEHKDEKNPHIHFYLIAERNEVLNELHDGKKAVSDMRKKNRTKTNKKDKETQKGLYENAMVAFQDDFYMKVSKKYGLSRTGKEPRTRIQSTTDYKKMEAERLMRLALIEEAEKKLILTNEEIIDRVEKSKIEIEKQKEKARIQTERERKKALISAESQGFNYAIKDFNNKSYLGKIAVSITYPKNEISRLKNKSNEVVKKYNILLDKSKKIEERKNFYKNSFLEIQEKEKKLRKDFNRRVEQRLDVVNSKNIELVKDNNDLSLENERLRIENEQAKFATDFLNRLKRKMGDKFNDFKKDLFKKIKPSGDKFNI